jgi:dolichyl-phosphate-mannose--protein O-mannosyl transferase
MTQERITKHFLARVVGFIVVPFIFYLIFFWIHFTILTHSGTGDGFMSPAFQETLIGNELLMNSHGTLGSGVFARPNLIESRLQKFATLTPLPSNM